MWVLKAEDLVLFWDHVGNNRRQHLLGQFLFSAPSTYSLFYSDQNSMRLELFCLHCTDKESDAHGI